MRLFRATQTLLLSTPKNKKSPNKDGTTLLDDFFRFMSLFLVLKLHTPKSTYGSNGATCSKVFSGCA